MTSETPEISTELALEDVGEDAPRWHKHAALMTVLIAALAAIAALFAGISAHEELVDRNNEIVEITQASRDTIYVEQLRTKHEILLALGIAVDPEEVDAIEVYENEATEFRSEAEEADSSAVAAGSTHLILAVAATVLGISIVVVGLSVIVSQPWVLAAGSVISVVGAVLLGIGLVAFVR